LAKNMLDLVKPNFSSASGKVYEVAALVGADKRKDSFDR
jgi:hypothetical protein